MSSIRYLYPYKVWMGFVNHKQYLSFFNSGRDFIRARVTAFQKHGFGPRNDYPLRRRASLIDDPREPTKGDK